MSGEAPRKALDDNGFGPPKVLQCQSPARLVGCENLAEGRQEGSMTMGEHPLGICGKPTGGSQARVAGPTAKQDVAGSRGPVVAVDFSLLT
jgi:hypothetical protein